MISHSCPFYLLYLHSFPLLNLPNHLQFEIPHRDRLFSWKQDKEKSFISCCKTHGRYAGFAGKIWRDYNLSSLRSPCRNNILVATMCSRGLCVHVYSRLLIQKQSSTAKKVFEPPKILCRAWIYFTYIYWCYSFIIRS